MKKFGIAALLACVLSFSASAGVGKTILMWLPNRILDLTDIVSLGIGVGGIKAEARVTRAIDFSAGDGFSAMIRKDVNRHYGITLEEGHHVNFLYFGCEDWRIDEVVSFKVWNYPLPGVYDKGSFKHAIYAYDWLCTPLDYGYDWKTGSRDWWEIGAEVSAGAAVRVAVHPLQIADFICGIFFFDLLDDDVVLK